MGWGWGWIGSVGLAELMQRGGCGLIFFLGGGGGCFVACILLLFGCFNLPFISLSVIRVVKRKI